MQFSSCVGELDSCPDGLVIESYSWKTLIACSYKYAANNNNNNNNILFVVVN